MTLDTLLQMDPSSCYDWLRKNRNAFEIMPVTPSKEMIVAVAGKRYSDEDERLITSELNTLIETHRNKSS